MGKYPKSRLNEKYSDWHWQAIKRDCYLADIDGFWVETRRGRGLIAAFDLKEPGAKITTTEKIVMDWFQKKGLPFYIVWATLDLAHFKVWRYDFSLIGEQFNENQFRYWAPTEKAEIKELNKWEYIEWIQKL